MTQVSGKVLVERPEWLKSCRVILTADSDPDSPIATLQMNIAPIFYFQNIPIDNKVAFLLVPCDRPF